MKNTNNKWRKRIAFGTVSAVGTVATVFAMASNSFASNKKSYSPKTILDQQISAKIQVGTGTAKKTVYTARPSEEAPNNLFTISPAIPKGTGTGTSSYSQYSDFATNFEPIYDGLYNLGMEDSILNPFGLKYRDAILNQFPALQAKFQSSIDEGISYFTDVNNIQEQFIAINQFHATNKELKIYEPEFIYDVNKAGETPSNFASFQTDGTTADVKYKIASIDLNGLKDQDKVLDYTITMPKGTATTSDVYHLIFNNDQNGIVKVLDKTNFPVSAATGDGIKKLLNSGQIILRDMTNVKTTSSTSSASLLDKFVLSYNAATNAIDIIAKTQGITKADPMLFKATDKDTGTASKIGFIDSSVAPLYKGGTNSFISTDAVQSIAPHAMLAKNEDAPTGGGHEFTMWMAANSAIKFKVQYTKAPGAWANGNDVTISFDGSNVESTPSSLALNKGTQAPTSGLIHYDSQKTTTDIGGVKYAKVHVYTDDGEITIEDGQNIRVPGKGEEKIFFETPGNNPGLLTSIEPSPTKHEVKVSTSTDVTDKWREYITNVYGSWFNLNPSAGDQWILKASEKQAERQFDINYEFYFENAQGGIIKVPAGTKDALLKTDGIANPEKLLINHEDATFAPTKGTNGKIETETANGKNAVMLLSEYFNHLTKWTHDKFNIDNKLKGEDYYKLSDPTDLDSIVKVLELNAPLAYSKLVERTDSLVKLAWEGYGNLTSQQKAYIDSLDDTNSPDYNYLGVANVKTKLNNFIGSKADPATGKVVIPTWSQQMIDNNHLIMMLIEKEIVGAVEEIFANETKTFDGIYSSLLGKAFGLYLDGSTGSYSAISPSALKVVDQSRLDPKFNGETVIAMDGSPSKAVTNGHDQLKSLLDFIKNFDLQTRYLSKAEATNFETFYNSGDILDKTKYASATDRKNVGDMIKIVDEIIKKIAAGSGIETIQSVTKQVETGSITSQEAADKIKNILNDVVAKITNPDGNAFKYSILSTEYSSSYLQNQVMGKNLSVILKTWLKTNSSSLSAAKIEQLQNSGLYDPDTLANMAVSSGYYNFDYFVESLTTDALVPATTRELLNSDFEDAIVFEIPESNSIIDFISDPGKLVEYGFMASGVLIALTAMAAFAVSRTRSSRNSGGSKKSSILVTGLFIGIAVLGLAIAGIGFIAF